MRRLACGDKVWLLLSISVLQRVPHFLNFKTYFARVQSYEGFVNGTESLSVPLLIFFLFNIYVLSNSSLFYSVQFVKILLFFHDICNILTDDLCCCLT